MDDARMNHIRYCLDRMGNAALAAVAHADTAPEIREAVRKAANVASPTAQGWTEAVTVCRERVKAGDKLAAYSLDQCLLALSMCRSAALLNGGWGEWTR